MREALVRDDLVDCIVALPAQLFYTTGIPVCLWFLDAGKTSAGERDRRGETLFIDARAMGAKISRTQIELGDEEIARVVAAYSAWRGQEDAGGSYVDEPGFCASATLADIEANGFTLSPVATSAPPRRKRTRSPSRNAWPSSSSSSRRTWPRTSGWRGRCGRRWRGWGMGAEWHAGWRIARLPDVIDFKEGPGILARDFAPGGVPLIRLAGITGTSLLDGCNYLEPKKVEVKWSHFRLSGRRHCIEYFSVVGEDCSRYGRGSWGDPIHGDHPYAPGNRRD